MNQVTVFWWFCYLDDIAFLVDDAPSFEHP